MPIVPPGEGLPTLPTLPTLPVSTREKRLHPSAEHHYVGFEIACGEADGPSRSGFATRILT
jgi:hypothetical protein